MQKEQCGFTCRKLDPPVERHETLSQSVDSRCWYYLACIYADLVNFGDIYA